MRLEVPIFQQSEPWSCLPACVRMCMAACGDERPEIDWSEILGATPKGVTLQSAHASLSEIGVDCDLEEGAFSHLEDHLAQGEPMILSVCVGVRGHSLIRHAVVLVGEFSGDFLINDPATGAAALWARDALEDAMEVAGRRALVMPPV